jgi:hypothetical protein
MSSKGLAATARNLPRPLQFSIVRAAEEKDFAARDLEEANGGVGLDATTQSSGKADKKGEKSKQQRRDGSDKTKVGETAEEQGAGAVVGGTADYVAGAGDGE